MAVCLVFGSVCCCHYCIHLDLDQQFWINESRDFNHRRSGPDVREHRTVLPSDGFLLCDVSDEDPRPDDVLVVCPHFPERVADAS